MTFPHAARGDECVTVYALQFIAKCSRMAARIKHEGFPLFIRPIALACCLASLCSAADAATPAESGFVCLIEARQTVNIRPGVEGLIESVPVQRGDFVKQGMLIAKLASAPELAAVNLARSRAGMRGEVGAAEARVDITQKKLQRAQELVKQNFVSANAKDEAEAEYRLATEQLHLARENRALAELELTRAEGILAQRSILSPVNGIVAQVMLKPGELTSSTQKDAIMSLLEIDPLNVEVVLPVREIGKIKVGQAAAVTLDAPLSGRYTARVEVVDRNLDATSGTFGVRLKLPNPRNRIPAGARCHVRF